MKSAVILSTLALVQAIVIPDAAVINDIQLEDTHRNRLSWLEDASSNAAHAIKKDFDWVTSEASNAVENVKHSVKSEFEHLLDEDQELRDAWEGISFDQLNGDDDTSKYTIYELISKCDKTSNFSKIVDKYDHVVKLLNDTEAELTLFVPVDSAFADIPKHHEKPSDEFIEHLLDYHVGLGEYPARRILSTHTLPTALKESWLGDKPQRLRTSFGLGGVRVNVYSKVIAADFKAKNGVIHAVNKILVPPAMIGREISLFPAQFSTLLLAYEKTDFVKFIHNVPMVGSTVFAPSNRAWEQLGIRANAFLFNTEKGKKYLKALLKYQIVANTTLYTDDVYYGDEKGEKSNDAGHEHFELKTLLHGKPLGVDIHTWKGFVAMVVNGYVKVGFTDAVGKNGVIQIVEKVPLPPCRKHHDRDAGEVSVQELMDRLDEYVNEDEEEAWVGEL